MIYIHLYQYKRKPILKKYIHFKVFKITFWPKRNNCVNNMNTFYFKEKEAGK